jgi:hypothetical protein
MEATMLQALHETGLGLLLTFVVCGLVGLVLCFVSME